MQGMTVGGVDPSILRELSGVYKPFIKAFKELVSNSYDADAAEVSIEFRDDFSVATVTDDGNGMSPFEFRNEFTRIGGSSRKWSREKTRKGRERIGNKGIGFLALARYADRMVIESSRPHDFQTVHRIPKTPASLDLRDVLGVPMSPELLQPIFECEVRKTGSTAKVRKSSINVDWKRTKVSISENVGPVDVLLRVDCRKLAFRATLDFDRLLKLADNADLEKLSDFTLIEVFKLPPKATRGTRISVEQLKPFVKRELRAERRKGFVRNVASRSGFEQLVWHLSRCTPIDYQKGLDERGPIAALLKDASPPTLEALRLRHGKRSETLSRPLYPFEAEAATTHTDMVTPVEINEGTLVAKGFIAGYESVVFPAEYRGVSIRVRGVAIGDPTFLGAEFLLTGAHKAALSQITGEINVLRGLDAVDSLNPGRESFYEESNDFQTLRRSFRGEGERVSGYLGKTIDAVLRRSQARSALHNVLGRAGYIRRAIDDVSAGVTHLMSSGEKPAAAIREMLKSKKSHANGLASTKEASFGVPMKVGSLRVKQAQRMSEPATIDYESGEVTIDIARPEWDSGIVLFKRRFDVIHKQGLASQQIAEIDFKDNRILVNWGHPAKLQMDERGFLRTALAWVLARTAAEGDADRMMEIAITLLSFTTQPND